MIKEKLRNAEFEGVEEMLVISHAREVSNEEKLRSPEKLVVYCYNSPKGEDGKTKDNLNMITTEDDTYEIKPGMSDAIVPQGEVEGDYSEVYDEDGRVIAWIGKVSIYVRFDITHKRDDNVEEIVEYTINKLSEEWTPIGEEEKEEIREKLKKEARKNLVEEMNKGIQREKEKIKNKIDEKQKNIGGLQERIEKSVKRIRREKKKLNGLNDDVDYEKKLNKQMETIEEMPKIKEVNLTADAISVKTKMLKIEGKKIGRYKIKYRINNLKSPWIGNLDGKDTPYQHPHIKHHTGICWGNAGQVTEHIANFDFDVATQMMLTVLQSWNEADCYINLPNFIKNDLKEEVR